MEAHCWKLFFLIVPPGIADNSFNMQMGLYAQDVLFTLTKLINIHHCAVKHQIGVKFQGQKPFHDSLYVFNSCSVGLVSSLKKQH